MGSAAASGADWDPVEVAARARDCDPAAFAELFDRYFERIRRYAYFQTGSADAADDVAAEVFSQALESIDRFDDRGGTIGAWLYGIARNVIAAYFRSASRVVPAPVEDGAPEEPERGPEEMLLEKLTHRDLYAALARLPEEQREVVILRFIEGYRVDVVARILGKRPGAVRAQQHRAVVALRKMFVTEGEGECETGMAYSG